MSNGQGFLMGLVFTVVGWKAKEHYDKIKRKPSGGGSTGENNPTGNGQSNNQRGGGNYYAGLGGVNFGESSNIFL